MDLINRQADDLISRKWLIECVEEGWIALDTEKDKNKFIHLVRDTAPSVEAEPVRHGHWETVDDWDGDEYYRCSECGAEFVLIDGTPKDNDYLYCPHCGALMDEVTSGD